jgi:hypothetical protein
MEQKKHPVGVSPKFKYGEIVKVNLLSFGFQEDITLEGKIVGLCSEGVITYWAIEFEYNFPNYPYKVVNVPHIFILDENKS